MCVFLVEGEERRVALDDCCAFLIACEEYGDASVELIAYVEVED